MLWQEVLGQQVFLRLISTVVACHLEYLKWPSSPKRLLTPG